MSSSKRPLSPHLQVYRPQITTVLSITHRATGVALAFCSLALVWVLVTLAMGPTAFAATQACLASPVGVLVLMVFSFCLMYHLFNGIRHLFWDAGKGFAIANVYRSAYAVLAASAVATSAIWWLASGGAA